jgi:hypothetical protein
MARTKFQRYWSFFSPGIKLIRWLLHSYGLTLSILLLRAQ